MSKPWQWSQEPSVAAFLPTSAKHELRAADAERFLAAGRETQFEVLLVLRERARDADSLIPSLSFIFAGLALVVSAYSLQTTHDPVSIITFTAVVIAIVVGVVFIARETRRSRAAAKWHDAYVYALQRPKRRRWF